MLKCPSCGSNVRFDIITQKLHCDFCSNYFEPTLFDSLQKDASLQEGSKPGETGLYEAAVWTCPGCGAVLTCADDTDITSVCAYCGGRNIMFERIRGERRPDSIVPFAVTKETCVRNYRKMARHAFLSPGYLRSKSQVESFRGIYMPYFDYYAELDGEYTLFDEILDDSESSGSSRVYNVHQVDGYIVGNVFGKTHDASVRFSDDISENLGSFNEKKPFSPGYLSGFYAESDDAGFETHLPSYSELKKKINEAVIREISNHSVEKGSEKVFIGTVDENSIAVTPKDIYAERTLYPVWFMSHRMGNGKLTYAAVNGSSGHVAADFPLSFLKVLLFALGAGLLIFLFLNLVGLMPRPITALGVSLLFFMGGTIFNSYVLERKIRRLNSDYTTKMTGVRQKLVIGVVATLPLILFSGGENTFWQICMLISRSFFIVAELLSMLIIFNMVNGIRMIENAVTRREIRMARAIPIIIFVVSYVVSLISIIVLFLQPVNEVYYYTAVLNAAAFMGLFVFTVLVNNYFSYRRPVQFDKKGGDDHAE